MTGPRAGWISVTILFPLQKKRFDSNKKGKHGNCQYLFEKYFLHSKPANFGSEEKRIPVLLLFYFEFLDQELLISVCGTSGLFVCNTNKNVSTFLHTVIIEWPLLSPLGLQAARPSDRLRHIPTGRGRGQVTSSGADELNCSILLARPGPGTEICSG